MARPFTTHEGDEVMVNMPVELYTDGSCLRNPGAGGYSYIIRYYEEPSDANAKPEEKVVEFCQGYRLTTNNRMELLGGISGLNAIISMVKDGTLEGCPQIILGTDSEYFAKAINQRWIAKWSSNNWMTSGYQGQQPKPVKNKDLWEQVLAVQNLLSSMNINLTVQHITGHNGHEFNERADKLAVSASHDSNNHLIDAVYEQTTPQYNKR